jgi:hypothetical protein
MLCAVWLDVAPDPALLTENLCLGLQATGQPLTGLQGKVMPDRSKDLGSPVP